MTTLDRLEIYHKARATCAEAYVLAGELRDRDLKDQIRRAATSVVLNIAEGRGRGSDADFARCLAIARGSNTELTAQLTVVGDFGLLPRARVAVLISDIDRVGRMISGLIRRLRG
ncbi:MAG: four helix bundle protein [Planctomycetes bacterium]|nr:four helix bundle protein [Planctomycetota bacterium]